MTCSCCSDGMTCDITCCCCSDEMTCDITCCCLFRWDDLWHGLLLLFIWDDLWHILLLLFRWDELWHHLLLLFRWDDLWHHLLLLFRWDDLWHHLLLLFRWDNLWHHLLLLFRWDDLWHHLLLLFRSDDLWHHLLLFRWEDVWHILLLLFILDDLWLDLLLLFIWEDFWHDLLLFVQMPSRGSYMLRPRWSSATTVNTLTRRNTCRSSANLRQLSSYRATTVDTNRCRPAQFCTLFIYSHFLYFPFKHFSLFFFSLCQGWGDALNLFTASSDSLSHPPLSLVFFVQSSSSSAFLTSLLTQSSHISLSLPRLLLPSSRNSSVVCHPPSFLRVLSTVVCSLPVSLSSFSALLSLPLTPPFSCLPFKFSYIVQYPVCTKPVTLHLILHLYQNQLDFFVLRGFKYSFSLCGQVLISTTEITEEETHFRQLLNNSKRLWMWSTGCPTKHKFWKS